MSRCVSVVVPFFNEEENVCLLFDEIMNALNPVDDWTYECVFVDDGSTDSTGTAISELAQREDRLRPVYLAVNAGQSAALMAGLRASKGDVLVTLDGDLQNDPADIPAVLKLLESYECVCGYRANRQDAWVRKVSSKVANGVRNAILSDGIRDTGCGLKGFRRECIDSLVCFNGVHRFMPALLRNAGFSIVECPANHRARQFGTSKYGINNRLWRGLYDLVGVAWLRRRLVRYELAETPAALRQSKTNPEYAPDHASNVIEQKP